MEVPCYSAFPASSLAPSALPSTPLQTASSRLGCQSAMNTTLIPWKDDPDFRGTSTILTSCVSTLLICVWSAIHLNIEGSTGWPRMARKMSWMVLGVIAPELLLLSAVCEYHAARRLTKIARDLLMPPREPPSQEKREDSEGRAVSQLCSSCIPLTLKHLRLRAFL